jgi:hypothetical protein
MPSNSPHARSWTAAQICLEDFWLTNPYTCGFQAIPMIQLTAERRTALLTGQQTGYQAYITFFTVRDDAGASPYVFR